MITALLLISSLWASEQTLVDAQKKKIVFQQHKGVWVEARCGHEACLSTGKLDFSQKVEKSLGDDRVNAYCRSALKGLVVNLKDDKQNDWGFCRLSDGSLVDKSLIRSQLGGY